MFIALLTIFLGVPARAAETAADEPPSVIEAQDRCRARAFANYGPEGVITAGDHGFVCLWDLARRTVKPAGISIGVVGFSPSAQAGWFAGAFHQSAYAFHPETKRSRTLSFSQDIVHRQIVSRDGKTVYYSAKETSIHFSSATNTYTPVAHRKHSVFRVPVDGTGEQSTLLIAGSTVTCLAEIKGGVLAVGEEGGRLRFIELRTGRAAQEPTLPKGAAPTACASSSDGHLAVGSEAGVDVYAPLPQGGLARRVRIASIPVASADRALSFSPDGKSLAVAAKNGRLLLFDVVGAKPRLDVPTADGAPPRSVGFLRGGALVAAADDRDVLHIYDAAGGREVFVLTRKTDLRPFPDFFGP